MIDINKTFVTSDHHFREWTHFGGLLCESSKEQEEEHIALWNSVVGKYDLVLYVGDYSDGIVRDLDDLYRKLNGRIVLIKGNHDVLDESIYRMAFADVVDRMYIDEVKLLLVHDPETATLRPGERMIYGHYHRGMVEPPPSACARSGTGGNRLRLPRRCGRWMLCVLSENALDLFDRIEV